MTIKNNTVSLFSGRPDPGTPRRTSPAVVLAGLLAVFAGSWLGSENIALRTALSDVAAPRNSVISSILQVGSTLPNVDVIDLTANSEGSPSTARLHQKLSRSTVLFLYTNTCPFCARSFPVAPTLYERLGHLSVDLVGLAVDGGLPDLEGRDNAKDGYAVFKPANDGAGRDLGVEVVPTFVLVDRTFKIVQVWKGELTEARVEEILRSARAASAPSG